MHIRTALLSAAVVLSVITLAASASLVQLTSYLNDSVQDFRAVFWVIEQVHDLERSALIHKRETLLYGLTGRDEHQTEAARRERTIRERLDALDDVPLEAKAEVVARVRKEVSEYLEDGAHADDATRDPVEHYLRSAESFEEAREAIRELRGLSEAWADAHAAEASEQDTRANRIGVALVATLVLVVALLILGGTRYLYRPVVALSEAIARFEPGRDAGRVEVEGPFELQEIARRYNGLVERLENQRRSQMTYLAAVAHDLRTPLAAMRLSMEVAARVDGSADADPRLARALGVLQRQLTVVSAMVTDLLEVGQVEAGQLALDRVPNDLAELVRDSVAMFCEAYPDREIVLSLPPAPVTVRCDGVRMRQVLGNLISNAIKYSPYGGPIEVVLEAGEAEARLKVCDHGLGIPEDERESIFEPFQRSRGTRLAIPGVGLGLAVSRRIVELHGGRVEVTSREGEGSTFTVVLPAPPEPPAGGGSSA